MSIARIAEQDADYRVDLNPEVDENEAWAAT